MTDPMVRIIRLALLTLVSIPISFLVIHGLEYLGAIEITRNPGEFPSIGDTPVVSIVFLVLFIALVIMMGLWAIATIYSRTPQIKGNS